MNLWHRLRFILPSLENILSRAFKTSPKPINHSKIGCNHLILIRSTSYHQSKPLSSLSKKILTSGFTSAAFGAKFSSQNGINRPETKMATFIEADKLFDEAKYDELYQLLTGQPEWENNAQVLWRLARCEFQLAKRVESTNKGEYSKLLVSAHERVKKSLELDDKNGLAHKWAAILLDAVSTLQGTKERVLQVLNVRQHMEKAIEFAPTDATSYYLLGEWHFSCYQVSWWERKIASIAFGKLPDADMEVALKMFEKAEEVEKDFYSKNKLMLAKTLFELKRDKERAVTLLDEVVQKYGASEKWDDKEAVEEAKKLIKQNK